MANKISPDDLPQSQIYENAFSSFSIRHQHLSI